jgi:D-glycero-D-manno-heptose 1,7-bisphosphate phosphatase
MQAIVLAGGFGTRLRARVADVPKPMAPVAGRPFLEYLLDRLADAGCHHVVLATGHMADVIQGHFGPRYQGMAIAYSHEAAPLGTGGAVVQAQRALPQEVDEPTLVLNGDSWLDVDLAAFAAWAAAVPDTDAMVLRALPDVARYGSVRLDGEMVVAFGEKAGSGPGLINAGIYRLRRATFSGYALPQAFSIENDFFAPHIAELGMRGQVCHGEFIDIGLPEDFDRAQTDLPRWVAHQAAQRSVKRAAGGKRKALFLDRDGVINADHGYVHRPDQVQFCDGIFELVRQARRRGYAVVVVTNQAGIGRGHYGEADFQKLSAWMLEQFDQQGAPIDRIYHCPDHPTHGIGPYRRESDWRKPNPGMLLQAASDLGLSLAQSIMVGDKGSDIQAGQRAGVARTVRVVHPAGASDDEVNVRADVQVSTLAEIIQHL